MSIADKQAYRFGFLKSEQWKTTRLARLAEDDARCEICGYRDLGNDVHHIYYPEKWDQSSNECLTTLCRHCHELIHSLLSWKGKASGIAANKEDFAVISEIARGWISGIIPKLDFDEEKCPCSACKTYLLLSNLKFHVALNQLAKSRNPNATVFLCPECIEALNSYPKFPTGIGSAMKALRRSFKQRKEASNG